MGLRSWVICACVLATLSHQAYGFSVRLDESFRQTISKIGTVEFVKNGEGTDALNFIRTNPLIKFDHTYAFVTMEWRRFPNERVEYHLELGSDNESIMQTPVANIPPTGCIPSTNWTKFNTTLPCIAKGTALLFANLSYTIRTYNTNVADVPLQANRCVTGYTADGTAGVVKPDRYDIAVLEIRKVCGEPSLVNHNDNGSSFSYVPVVTSVSIFILLLVIITGLAFRYQKRKVEKKIEKRMSVKNNGRAGVSEYDERYIDSQEQQYRETNVALTGQLLRTLMNDISEKWTPQFEQLTISRAHICVTDEIGKGAFGEVYIGTVLSENKTSVQGHCAIKKLPAIYSARDVEEFLQEARILKDFQHENILGLIGVCMDQEGPLVCLELMHHGDLKAFLRTYRRDHSQENLLQMYEDPPTMTINHLNNFCLQIASGMAYLVTKKFVHRDLAARNCLLDASLTVKIGDFGLARDIHYGNYYRMSTGRPLPVKWMALESIGDQIFTSQSDVWAFGIVVWEIFSLGLTPYPGIANHEMRDTLLSGMRPARPYNCPASLYAVMQRCWLVEPPERPSFKELVDFLKGMSPGEYENIDVQTLPQPDYQNLGSKQSSIFQRQGSTTMICESYENMYPARSSKMSDAPSEELSLNPSYHQIIPVTNGSLQRPAKTSLQHYSSDPVEHIRVVESNGSKSRTARPYLESDI